MSQREEGAQRVGEQRKEAGWSVGTPDGGEGDKITPCRNLMHMRNIDHGQRRRGAKQERTQGDGTQAMNLPTRSGVLWTASGTIWGGGRTQGQVTDFGLSTWTNSAHCWSLASTRPGEKHPGQKTGDKAKDTSGVELSSGHGHGGPPASSHSHSHGHGGPPASSAI